MHEPTRAGAGLTADQRRRHTMPELDVIARIKALPRVEVDPAAYCTRTHVPGWFYPVFVPALVLLVLTALATLAAELGALG